MFQSLSSEDYLSAQLNNSSQFFGRGKGWQEDSSCCRASQPTHTAPQTHTHTRNHGNAGAARRASAGRCWRCLFHVSTSTSYKEQGGSTVMMSRRGRGIRSLGGGGGTAEPDDHPSTSLTLRVHHPSLAFQPLNPAAASASGENPAAAGGGGGGGAEGEGGSRCSCLSHTDVYYIWGVKTCQCTAGGVLICCPNANTVRLQQTYEHLGASFICMWWFLFFLSIQRFSAKQISL